VPSSPFAPPVRPAAGPESRTDSLTAVPPVGGEAPSTIAVALAHDPANDAVPQVVASGKGWVAEQILALAFANGVKVRQDADLVQILSAVDVESDIPPEAFSAVAEILAYVYKANATLTPSTGEDHP